MMLCVIVVNVMLTTRVSGEQTRVYCVYCTECVVKKKSESEVKRTK